MSIIIADMVLQLYRSLNLQEKNFIDHLAEKENHYKNHPASCPQCNRDYVILWRVFDTFNNVLMRSVQTKYRKGETAASALNRLYSQQREATK